MKAKKEGSDAFSNGVAANPYPAGSLKFRAWREGWTKAERHARTYGASFESLKREKQEQASGQHYQPRGGRAQQIEPLYFAKDITARVQRVA